MTATPDNPNASGLTSLLDPQLLAGLSRVELVAGQLMDGYVQGLHRSPHIGFALDFAQHRPYAPGDDIKRIDWRAYAKADRYFIKQYEVTTALRAHLVVDASGSMAYQGKKDPVSKFRYSQFLAACLAYLILHQQDAVGLTLFGEENSHFIPARSASSQLFSITQALEKTTPGSAAASLSKVLHEVAERLDQRQMVIVISDLFDDREALIQSLHHLRHRRHEVLLFQVVADEEMSFPFRNVSAFESLEQRGQELKLDPTLVRATYLENFARHMEAIRFAASNLRIEHELFKTNEPLDRALGNYLSRRTGGGGIGGLGR